MSLSDSGLVDLTAKSQMRQVAGYLRVLNDVNGSPPIVAGQMLDWIELVDDHVRRHGDDYDWIDSGRRIVDYWKQDFLLISVDGKLSAIASKGGDGVWENGLGDDIVIWLNDMNKESRK